MREEVVKRACAVWVCFLMIFSAMTVFVDISEPSEAKVVIKNGMAYNVTTPFRINSNAEFASMAASKGWPGDGSQATPYIIDNYDINGSGYGYCIYVGNTTCFFKIQNCYLHHTIGGNGIGLLNTQNCIIENNTIKYNDYHSIRLVGSSHNQIINNFISNTSTNNGICLDTSCNYNNINNNTILSSDLGGIMLFMYNYYNKVSNNTISNSYYGIYVRMSNYNDICHNNISQSNVDDIRLDTNNHNKLLYNNANIYLDNSHQNYIFNNQGRHLSIDSSNSNYVWNNTICNSGTGGISLSYGSSYNRIYSNNAINNSDEGISISGSSNLIACNNCSDNSEGIWITPSSSSNTIINNQIVNNSWRGLRVESSNNLIYHNNLINNENPSFPDLAFQAWDSGSNQWDNNYPSAGNYWSDYTGSDLLNGPNQDQPGSDGIGDEHYNSTTGEGIKGGLNEDKYPLMNPYQDVNPPNSSVDLIETYWHETSDLLITSTISDTDSPIVYVELWYSFEGSSYILYDQAYDAPYQWSFNWPNGEGNYTFYTRALDGALNYENIPGTYDGDAGYDKTPPISSVINIISPYCHNVNPLMIFTSANDNMSGVSNLTLYYRFSFENVSWTGWIIFDVDYVEPWSWDFVFPLGDGFYEFNSIAKDQANNIEPTKYNAEALCWYDGSSPIITLIRPTNNSVIRPNTILDFDVSDPHLNEVNYSINNGTTSNFSAPYDIDTTGWTDGLYNVKICAVDTLGQKVSKFFNFIIDSINPIIILNSPINNSIIKGGTIIDINVVDDNIDSVNYSVNGGVHQSLTPLYDVYTTSWLKGFYTLVVQAIDKAGNAATNYFSFTIDSTKPSIILNSPANNSCVKTGSLIDFNVSDDNIQSVNYSIDGSANQTFYSPYDIATIGWLDGIHTIEVHAVDRAGNAVTGSYTFTFDGTPPTVVSTTPVNGSTGIALDANFVTVFNEMMNTTSVINSISISPSINVSSCEWNANKTILTIVFSYNLIKKTTYTITLSNGIKDTVGNSPASSYSWSFTTWLDNDNDGVSDQQDTDDDNDGYLDDWETAFGTDPLDPNSKLIDTDGDGKPDGDATNSQPWMDTDDDNDGIPDSEDPNPINPANPTTEDKAGIIDFWWVFLIIAIVLIITALFFMRRKSEVEPKPEPELETELCPKCGFDIEKGKPCPFCSSKPVVEKKSEPIKVQPAKAPQPAQKPSLSNEELIARIEKLHKQGKMSEEAYQRNMAKFKK